jgi:aspartokinase
MTSSEVKISLLIEDDKTEKAVKALHKAFALGNEVNI